MCLEANLLTHILPHPNTHTPLFPAFYTDHIVVPLIFLPHPPWIPYQRIKNVLSLFNGFIVSYCMCIALLISNLFPANGHLHVSNFGYNRHAAGAFHMDVGLLGQRLCKF